MIGQKEFARLVSGYEGFAIAIGLVVLLPVVFSPGLAAEILIFGLFALAFNILFGFAGYLSFGHALFFGSGAYLTAVLIIELGLPVLPVLLLVILFGGVLALAVGAIVVRLGGLGFALVTLAIAQLGYEIVLNAGTYTGGANGLSGITRTGLLFSSESELLADTVSFYLFVVLVFLLCLYGIYRMYHSLFGRMLLSIRTNEERTAALGINTYWVKLLVFILSGILAAIAGSLWAFYIRFVSPEVLFWQQSGDGVMATLIGGMYSILGPVIGAGFLEITDRTVFSTDPALRSLLLGVIFIIVVMFEPGGLVGIVERLRNRLQDDTE